MVIREGDSIIHVSPNTQIGKSLFILIAFRLWVSWGLPGESAEGAIPQEISAREVLVGLEGFCCWPVELSLPCIGRWPRPLRISAPGKSKHSQWGSFPPSPLPWWSGKTHGPAQKQKDTPPVCWCRWCGAGWAEPPVGGVGCKDCGQ